MQPPRFGMRPKGHIDRRKHEVDVTERVLQGGVWAGPAPIHNARVVGIDFRLQQRFLGPVSSAVRVKTFGDDRDPH